tara:strand:- start:6565 stop:7443 length:879 start_codon:yes stop_codon:yes gene_type:complete
MGKLRKIGKKIGRGIKKVVKKVGRAFGKLGIVGQLGMMFLMPYAMSGLSSLWSSTVGKAFGQFATSQAGTFASNLVAKGGIKGAIGQAMGAIHSAGSAIGTAYNSISTAISNGFDRAGNFLEGKGFTLTPDAGAIDPDMLSQIKEVSAQADKVTQEAIMGKEAKKSLLEKGTEFASESWDEFKKDLTDPRQYGKKGARLAFAHLQEGLAPDLPVQKHLNISPFDIGTIDTYNSQGIFNEIDFSRMNTAYQSQGSSWGGMNQIGQSYLMQQASMGDTNYINDMRRLQGYGGGI